MTMYAQRLVVNVTADGAGNATAYSDPVPFGKLSQIVYVKNNFTNGVVFNITAEATGETLWSQSAVNASAVVAPRQPTHSTAGVAALYAAAGTAVNDKIALANDRIKISITGAGAGTLGAFHFLLGE